MPPPSSQNLGVCMDIQIKAKGQNVVGQACDRSKPDNDLRISLDGMYVPPPPSQNSGVNMEMQTEAEGRNIVGCGYNCSKPVGESKVSLDKVYVPVFKDGVYLHWMDGLTPKTQSIAQ